MSRFSFRPCMLIVVAAAALAGCAARPPVGDPDNLQTSSDQTENQRRAHIRLQLAVGYYQHHELKVALDEVKRALQADPASAEAYSMGGLIYMSMGESRLAEDYFQQALKLAPGNPDFSNNYGWFLCQSGHPRESIPYFEKAFRNRGYESPAKALDNAGACSLKLKETDAAQKYFLQAFQLDPSNLATSANLARIYYDKHDYERAHFYINRVVKAEAVPADMLWLAIKIERKFGDRASEASLAAQLSRRYPDSAAYAAYQRGAFNE